MTETEKKIERTIHIGAARTQVFRSLMDPAALSRWLFATVTIHPEEGKGFSFEWKDSASPATAQGEILEMVPDERLVLSWYMDADGVTSNASFDLSDDPAGGTLLRFVHSGLPQDPGWLPRFQRVALEWDKVLLNLCFLLEEHGQGKHLFYLRLERTLRAAPNRAFRCWLSTSGLGAWMARDVCLIPEEGHELSGVTLDTGKALAVVFHKIESDRHIRMTWSEGGLKGLLGVSFWPSPDGVALTLTLRSFALMEGERPIIQALWEHRLQRLEAYLNRDPLPLPSQGNGTFTVTRRLEATPARVWNAVTDAALLRRWLVSWTDFEPRPGAPFTLLWDSYGEIRGLVVELVPGEWIRYSWDLPELDAPTEVTMRVRPDAKQPGLCEIEVTHAGWGDGPLWDLHRGIMEGAWIVVLAVLDFYLRHGAGKERQEFHVRRRLPLSLERALPLCTTAQGLQSWLAARAVIEGKVAAPFELDMPDRVQYRGRVVAWRAVGEWAVELAAPVPAFLEWGVAPEAEGSRLGVTLTTYTAPENWVEGERARWTAAMDALAGTAWPA
jgi:uncharacterized protein YndB with AHSA1/START domain